jgi:DNA-binding transcriptional MerR regulator
VHKLTIGQVTGRTGVGAETIRYYERHGLLKTPKRFSNGYRLFTEDTIQRLDFIRQTKTLGFTLTEIKEMLVLRTDTLSNCSKTRVIGKVKLRDVEEKIAALQKIKGALKKLVLQRPRKRPGNGSPILDLLNS